MSVRQRKRRDHLHRLAVLDFPEVFLGLTVGDDAKAVVAHALCSSLSVVFVEVNPDLVGTQRRLSSPDDVFNRRV